MTAATTAPGIPDDLVQMTSSGTRLPGQPQVVGMPPMPQGPVAVPMTPPFNPTPPPMSGMSPQPAAVANGQVPAPQQAASAPEMSPPVGQGLLPPLATPMGLKPQDTMPVAPFAASAPPQMNWVRPPQPGQGAPATFPLSPVQGGQPQVHPASMQQPPLQQVGSGAAAVPPMMPGQLQLPPSTPPQIMPPVAPPPAVTAGRQVVAAATAGVATNPTLEQQLLLQIQQEVQAVKFQTGIRILEGFYQEPNCQQGNTAHVAIWACRFEPMKLVDLDISILLGYEAALTAHQVYVQSLEKQWAAECETLGIIVAQIKETQRGQSSADRVKLQEIEILSTPANRPVYERFLLAKHMAKVLEGMGERFAQMEDGLKRAITRSMLEHRHSYKQGQYQ